jgi:hypothetical protein
LRSTLEEALETHVASTVLFEALGAAGAEVPQSREEVLAVVRGPLREVLARRLDAEHAAGLVTRLEEQLGPPPAEPGAEAASPDDVSTVELPLDELAERTSREDETTAVPTAEAVRVLVLAAGSGFARRLELTLGERRVEATHVDGPAGLARALEAEPPAIALLDATDFPAIDRSAVLAAAADLPGTTACVLWGAELPYGRRFVEGIDEGTRRWVLLELREGIGPLLDLVRSRRRSRRAT